MGRSSILEVVFCKLYYMRYEAYLYLARITEFLFLFASFLTLTLFELLSDLMFDDTFALVFTLIIHDCCLVMNTFVPESCA